MKRVDRYLAGVLLMGALPVLMLLLGLFGFVTLAEELEDVGKGRFEDADALRVALLTLPRIAIDLLPVAALLGGVMALGNLAGEQELTVLRAAGMSQWRLAYPLFAAAMLLSGVVLLAQQYVVPRLEHVATEIRGKALISTVRGSTTEFWTRDEQHFIRVGDVRYGTIPTDIEIYDLGSDRTVRRVLQAESADVIGPGRWLLRGVSERRISIDRSDTDQRQVTKAEVVHQRQASLTWQSFLSPDQMTSLIAPIQTLTVTDLYNYVGYLDDAGLSSHRYRFRFWQVLSLPIGLLAMCLLGLPFVLGSVRSRPPGARILFGATVGIGFYLVEQTASQLAVLYELPALPMAVLPDFALLGASIFTLTRVE
jgi:lipopolysaccharide export system permease protein